MLSADDDLNEPVRPWRFLLLGMILAIGAANIAFALNYVDASLYIVILRMQPAVLMLISTRLLGEQIPLRGWVALGMILVGVLMVKPEVFTLSLERDDMIGISIGLLHVMTNVTYNLGQQRFIRGVRAKGKAAAWTMTGTLLTLLPFWVFSRPDVPQTPLAVAAVLGIAIVATALPIFSIYEAIARLGATRFSLVISVEPVLAITLAVLFLGERFLPIQIVGAFLIMASVPVLEGRVSWLSLGRRRPVAPPLPTGEGGD